MTIACIDVGYSDIPSQPTTAIAACVLIKGWTDCIAAGEVTIRVKNVLEYCPGQFYRRELPCIKAVLAKLAQPPAVIVIDGYVWLGGEDQPGLGKYLYDDLKQATSIIGVAKSSYKESHHAARLYRGGSTRPLFITSIGMATAEAASCVAAMHGDHRIPTILARVDRLSRGD